MEVDPGDIVVGLMVTGFGFAGLFLAAGSLDDEMYVFGMSLTAFAVAFVLGLVARHFDRAPTSAGIAAAADAMPGLSLARSAHV